LPSPRNGLPTQPRPGDPSVAAARQADGAHRLTIVNELHHGAELPPVARRVDAALADIDDALEWLTALSPLHTHELWEQFQASGCRELPELGYPPLHPDLQRLRKRLLALPVSEVEQPDLEALLWEKQRELDRLIELMLLRNTRGLLLASIDLWGEAEFALVDAAEDILGALAHHYPSGPMVRLDTVRAEAERQIRHYRERDPRFASQIVVDADLGAKLMVRHGHLHIAEDIEVPEHQVTALVSHEVGTHSLTRHNGSLQPLLQLQCGLAHYDSLQEGLAVLSEYLSGYLAPERVRIIAARVVAVRMICHGYGAVDIHHHLVDDHQLDPHEAFHVALRVQRAGGLTKDVVYLRGLGELLGYLRSGGDFEFLFVGKFAMAHVPELVELERLGLVRPPALLPAYLDTTQGRFRLERARHLSLQQLATEDRDR
jgi:uncharacterized protein (TIGR02421 family)